MINRLIAFSLEQRLVVLALTILLMGWGLIAFVRLPIEAYPELSDVQVQVIALFPGRAAQEREQQMGSAREAAHRRGGMSAVLIACVLLTSAASRATAEASRPDSVTLADALDLLEQQNPDTHAARLQIAEAEAVRLTARLCSNPTLSVDVTDLAIGHTNPPGLSPGQTTGSTVRLDQPLALWGTRRLRLQGAEAGIAAAKAQEHDALRRLRAAAKDAFYGVLHDRQLLEFAAANRQRYHQIVELNQRRFRSGAISLLELLDAERTYVATQTDYLDAAFSDRTSLDALERAIGIDVDTQ